MKKIVFTLAILALAVSCIEDSRSNFMVDDTLTLVYDEQVVPVSVFAGTATVTVIKSGIGRQAATATLEVSADSLDSYNAENGTSYTALSAPYSFSSDKVEFGVKDVTSSVSLTWDPKTVYPVLDGANSVIPVTIGEGSLKINGGRNLLLLNILNSTVSLASSGSTVVASESESEDREVSVKVSLDNTLPSDLKVTLSADNSLVAAYNAENGTDHRSAPDGFVLFPEGGLEIEAGLSDGFATVTLDNSALFSAGKMMSFNSILVPIRISATSQTGLIISDGVYWLVVRSPFSGAAISRVWGKYSTERVWTEDYGLPFGADRNLALDGNWVYLPYAVGGDVAKITAISVTDPDVTKQVNCEGFQSNTITTACVRMVDKGDGTLMLTASGANNNDFAFYTWTDGIDNAPTYTSLQCTWRRGGDRYEFHGTWADGTMYVHAYLGTFSTRYIVKNGSFVSTERTLVNVPFTGFGGLYKHPDYDQLLFASTDASALLTPTGTTYKAGDGQDVYDMSQETFDGAELTFGYRAFTFGGENYIAYTTADKNDELDTDGLTPVTSLRRARLVVVRDKGGFKASLNPDNMDVFYEAPLQGPEFTDIAVSEPMTAQGDCAVCVLSNCVYIAAGFQGLGVSVFKME